LSTFDGERLPASTFKLDSERLRSGWYSDKYFSNILRTLQGNAAAGPGAGYLPGEAWVELQVFTRRQPRSLLVGMDKALAILKEGCGYFEGGRFVPTWSELEVEALQDGEWLAYGGDPLEVEPALRIRGRYRDFALLETPLLGVLTRGTRIATNVYEVLEAARGKPVLFFPARFDAHEIQAADGYAYQIAVQRYRLDAGRPGPDPQISTDAQGDWWGGAGGGTVAHSLIACYLGDTAGAMLDFARYVPSEVPRIALVDFNNDCLGESLQVARVLWEEHIRRRRSGDPEADRFRLDGVRPDTAATLRDRSVEPLGDPRLDLGVNPRLVFQLHSALRSAYLAWELLPGEQELARAFCARIRIVVTGGFSAERIRAFERLGVPADVYGVGSSLLSNSQKEGTTNDFTADVVRVRLPGGWREVAKAGRRAVSSSRLRPVDLAWL
jgi:nicotinate phosphoribosyltransferase